MKRNHIIFLFLLFSFYACKENDKQPSGKSENNVDAARNFIRAALDGKFREARSFMIQDSINTNYMDVVERSYQKTDQNTKDGYRTSTIRFYPLTEINDSTTIIVYSNSFKNDPDTLKVLRIKEQWLVDLKYLYLHDMDTTINKTSTKDTMQ